MTTPERIKDLPSESLSEIFEVAWYVGKAMANDVVKDSFDKTELKYDDYCDINSMIEFYWFIYRHLIVKATNSSLLSELYSLSNTKICSMYEDFFMYRYGKL